MNFVGSVGRDVPRTAGTEIPGLVSYAEAHRSTDDEPELLVVVAVLGHPAAGIELDDGEGHPVAVHHAGENAVPDSQRTEVCEVVERAHFGWQP